MIRLGDCFSGIGGNSVGFICVFKKNGIVIWGSELDHNKYGKYLKTLSLNHFPEKLNLGDITVLIFPPEIDIIDGGFPCQDISRVNCNGSSGTSGIKSSLFKHQLRLAKEVNSSYIHFENSSDLYKKGMNVVLYYLNELKYHVQWKTFPLYIFGLPHERMRTYIIAYKENPTLMDIFDTPENFMERYSFKFNMSFDQTEMTFDTEKIKKQNLLVISNPIIQFRLNSLGNSVHTTASTFVHDAIKRHMNNQTNKFDEKVTPFGHIKDFYHGDENYTNMPKSGMMIDGIVYETPTIRYKRPSFTIPTPLKTISCSWEDAFCWSKYNSKDRIHIGKVSTKLKPDGSNKPSLISQDPTLLFKKWYLLNMGADKVKDIEEFKTKIEPNLPKLVANPNLIELLMGFPIDWTKP